MITNSSVSCSKMAAGGWAAAAQLIQARQPIEAQRKSLRYLKRD